MSVNGDAAKHDELVALYDGPRRCGGYSRIVCLRLFAGMGPRIAPVKLVAR